MRLLFFIPSLTGGGAERVTANLANHWAAKGWNITIVMLAPLSLDFYELHPAVGRIAFELAGESRNVLAGLWNNLHRVRALPRFARKPYALAVMGPRELKFLAIFILKGRPWGYFSNIVNYSKRSLRGMSYWHDRIDWIGGYPFEVAKPEEIFCTYRRMERRGGHLA